VKETWTGFGSNTAFAAAQGVPLAPGIRMARHLVIAAGRRVEVYEWREGKLGMIAIFDSFSWVKDVTVINDLIFFGDILGCVRLAKWRDDDHQIIECGSDALLRVRLSSIGLVIDDGTLGLVVTDDEGNLLVDVCSPTEQPKMRLKLRADFHVGSVTRRLVRSRMAVPLGTAVSERKRFATFFGTRAGSVSALLPLDEMSFKRLLMLQKIMTYCLPHAAGLNPRLWRLFASSLNPGGSGSRPRAKNFLDGNLLSRYLSLSTHTQRVFAEAIGSSPERILASLRTIAVSSTCF
jgi:cleavage and polyadenylation specificity factor subunit 1